MKLNPYLLFKGNCREAFAFYQKTCNGKMIMMMTGAESPMADQIPADQRDQVLHANLELGPDLMLLASDAPPDRYQKPQGFSLSYGVDSSEEAQRIFHALAEGGSVTLPIAPTFWSPMFGMLVDRFDIPWMISCDTMVDGASTPKS
jgi:PhnB protein